MNNLLQASRIYVLEGIRAILTRLLPKKVVPYHSDKIPPITYFKKGDRVETADHHIGTVWRVYSKIKTGKPAGCSVVWDTTYQGEKITPIVSVIDKSPKFNPLIRRLTM